MSVKVLSRSSVCLCTDVGAVSSSITSSFIKSSFICWKDICFDVVASSATIGFVVSPQLVPSPHNPYFFNRELYNSITNCLIGCQGCVDIGVNWYLRIHFFSGNHRCRGSNPPVLGSCFLRGRNWDLRYLLRLSLLVVIFVISDECDPCIDDCDMLRTLKT